MDDAPLNRAASERVDRSAAALEERLRAEEREACVQRLVEWAAGLSDERDRLVVVHAASQLRERRAG